MRDAEPASYEHQQMYRKMPLADSTNKNPSDVAREPFYVNLRRSKSMASVNLGPDQCLDQTAVYEPNPTPHYDDVRSTADPITHVVQPSAYGVLPWVYREYRSSRHEYEGTGMARAMAGNRQSVQLQYDQLPRCLYCHKWFEDLDKHRRHMLSCPKRPVK